jgi:hypothetical protein
MLNPPYGEIADLLKQGQVVPFLGAGVNLGTRAEGAKWNEATSDFLPSAAELSRYLARRISFPSTDARDCDDLAKVASYFVETSARLRLRERLQHVFDRDCQPSQIHHYLAGLARHVKDGKLQGTPLLIVTTNYDDLVEQAFEQADPPRPYDLVVYPTDREDVGASVLLWKHGAVEPEAIPPKRLFVDLDTTNVIYKMHGSVGRGGNNLDSYVITEEDYVDFLSRMTSQGAVPALFMRYFRSRHFLFLGYGLQDWNLRVVLKNLRTILPKVEEESGGTAEDAGTGETMRTSNDLRSWAIQFRPSVLEQVLWEARQVKIYDVDINKFVDGLKEEGM